LQFNLKAKQPSQANSLLYKLIELKAARSNVRLRLAIQTFDINSNIQTCRL